jgi:hypothetical protein
MQSKIGTGVNSKSYFVIFARNVAVPSKSYSLFVSGDGSKRFV